MLNATPPPPFDVSEMFFNNFTGPPRPSSRALDDPRNVTEFDSRWSTSTPDGDGNTHTRHFHPHGATFSGIPSSFHPRYHVFPCQPLREVTLLFASTYLQPIGLALSPCPFWCYRGLSTPRSSLPRMDRRPVGRTEQPAGPHHGSGRI